NCYEPVLKIGRRPQGGQSEACPPFRRVLDDGWGARLALPTLRILARCERSVGAAHTPSSLNLSATSAAIASTAACASGPFAETTTEVPGPAASIIRPMIEVPPTVSLPRVTQTSALNFSTICTNFAEARACRPRLLMI